jgi:hypothetical protein
VVAHDEDGSGGVRRRLVEIWSERTRRKRDTVIYTFKFFFDSTGIFGGCGWPPKMMPLQIIFSDFFRPSKIFWYFY